MVRSFVNNIAPIIVAHYPSYCFIATEEISVNFHDNESIQVYVFLRYIFSPDCSNHIILRHIDSDIVNEVNLPCF